MPTEVLSQAVLERTTRSILRCQRNGSAAPLCWAEVQALADLQEAIGVYLRQPQVQALIEAQTPGREVAHADLSA